MLYERLAWNAFETDYSHEGLKAARVWQEKEYATALAMEDEILIKVAEVCLLWNQVGFDLNDETMMPQLEDLRSFFAPNFSTSLSYYAILDALQILHTKNKAYEQAILYGKQRLNIAIEWQDLFWMSGCFHGLADTYAQMGLTNQAKQQYLDMLEWHLAIGQQWQTLGFLWSYMLHHSHPYIDKKTAVTILSIVYQHLENLPYYKQRIDKALPQFRADLGEDLFVVIWEKGKALDFDTAISLVRTALTTSET